jgi:DUF2895 family protein
MSGRYPIDALLRPPVEFVSVVVASTAAWLAWIAPGLMNALRSALKPLFTRFASANVATLTVGEGRYRALIDNVQVQNRRLWGLIAVLVVLLAFAVYGLHRARQALPPVHIPPELRFGAMLAWGEVPHPTFTCLRAISFSS